MKKQVVYQSAAKKLKDFRVNVLGMTQAELIKPFKRHIQAVSNWERGICLPPKDIFVSVFLSKMSPAKFIAFKDALAEDLVKHVIDRATAPKKKAKKK